MMYVMLSPYLLHEIGSRNISLIGSNLIVGSKSQLYFVYTLSEEPVTLLGGGCHIHLICQNIKMPFLERTATFSKRKRNRMRNTEVFFIHPVFHGLTSEKYMWA